jgi:phosphoribosylglycinamide formyltransferase 1
MMQDSKRIAILLSGRGSNFEAIADSIDAGRLDAEIAVVISNRPEARGLEIARQRGLNAVVIPSKGVAREVYDGLLVEELNKYDVALVCLAGYMKLLSPVMVRAFASRILNIHPSLLPAFPGLEVQQKALDHGVKISGCTVHFVDEDLDAGPIVLQAAVPVLDSDTADTLAARILKEEHRIYSQAIGIVLSGKYRVVGRRVLTQPAEPPRGRSQSPD